MLRPGVPTAAEKLHAEPVNQHDPGGHVESEDKNEPRQHLYFGARKLHQVGAHHAGDSPAGAHHGNARIRVDHHLRQPRGYSARQVEQKVLAMAENIFHVIAEYPQEQHVAQHVHPAGVQKHVGE